MSPPDKNGYDAAVIRFFTLRIPLAKAATDGNAMTYAALGAMGEAEAAPVVPQILSTRGPDGWTTRTLNPPYDPTSGAPDTNHSQFWGFNDELSRAIVATVTDPPLAPGAAAGANAKNLYVVDLGKGFQSDAYRLLAGFHLGTPGQKVLTGGAFSENLEHVAFELGDQFAPTVAEAFINESGDPQQRIVSPSSPPSARLGAGWIRSNRTPSAMARDGSRILFGSPAPTQGGLFDEVLTADDGPGDLWLYDSRTEAAPTTTWVSEPEAGVPVDPSSPRLDAFWGASADASKVFFTSGEKLTADSTADPTTNSFGDLYIYDYETGDLRDISIDTGHPNGARIHGVVGISDDGGRAYFVARGRLGTGEGTDGQPNLFHWQDGPANGDVTFIATLAPHVVVPSTNAGDVDASDYGVYLSGGYNRSARITPDGRSLAFDSLAPLTEDDSDSARDVYLYDADGDTLECASCSEAETAPGDSTLRYMGPSIDGPPGVPEAPQPFHHFTTYHNLSNDGSKLYFQSEAALVSRDTNGYQDVYTFDTASGEVALLSSGQGVGDAYFLDATPDGSDVFFATRERLVPTDPDDSYDVYDARVEGGIPSQNAAPNPVCVGEECQGKISKAPIATAPGSVGHVGPGRQAGRGSKSCLAERRRVVRRARHARNLARRARTAAGKRARQLSKRLRRAKRRARKARREVRVCRRER